MVGTRIFFTGTLCAALFAGLVGTADAQRQQWKWRDANGRITVSDLPPPRSVPQQNILERPDVSAPTRLIADPPAASAVAASAAASSAPKVDPELQARKEAAEQAEAQRAQSEAQKSDQRRAENCRNARAHLAALNTGQRIARYNTKGEREILDDKQRASETRRAQEVITSECR